MRPVHNARLAKSKQLISSEKSSAQTSTKSAPNGRSTHREKQIKRAQFSFICAETRDRGFKLHRNINKLRLAPSLKPLFVTLAVPPEWPAWYASVVVLSSSPSAYHVL
jgi:hypothetical protein